MQIAPECLISVLQALASGRFDMSTVEEIKSAISLLSEEDYAHLREWLSEKDWERWDGEIERDSASGKLDFLRGFKFETQLLM